MVLLPLRRIHRLRRKKDTSQAEAREIRKFSEMQGGLLESTTLVFGSLSAIAFLVSIMGASSAMQIYLRDRREEIGIRKAIGSTDSKVFRQFLSEMLISTAPASLLGYEISLGVAEYVSEAVFSSQFEMGLELFWIVLGTTIDLTFLSVLASRTGIKETDPVNLMR